MLNITYECPTCGNTWTELYECACDSECDECGEGAISAASWTEVPGVPDRPLQTWQVTRTIVETVQIQARSEAEAIHLARDAEAGQWARDDVDEWFAITPPELRIAGLPIR